MVVAMLLVSPCTSLHWSYTPTIWAVAMACRACSLERHGGFMVFTIRYNSSLIIRQLLLLLLLLWVMTGLGRTSTVRDFLNRERLIPWVLLLRWLRGLVSTRTYLRDGWTLLIEGKEATWLWWRWCSILLHYFYLVSRYDHFLSLYYLRGRRYFSHWVCSIHV